MSDVIETTPAATPDPPPDRADDTDDGTDEVVGAEVDRAGARGWRRAVAVGLCAYAVARLCVLGGAAVRAMQVTVDQRVSGETEQGALTVMTGVLTQWDGLWYLELVRSGYPTSVPADITYNQLEACASSTPSSPAATPSPRSR